MPPTTTTTFSPATNSASAYPSQPSYDLPDLPAPPSWLLPTAIFILILGTLLALLAYRLTFPHGIDSEFEDHDDDDDDDDDDNLTSTTKNSRHARPPSGLPVRGEVRKEARGQRGHERTKSRIQKIWEERSKVRAMREEGREEGEMQLLPQTPGHWGCDEGGASAIELGWWGGGDAERRRRGGYTEAPGVEDQDIHEAYHHRDEELEEVGRDDDDEPALTRRGFLETVNAGLDWCIEKVTGYLDDEGEEEELVFPVTKEERGEVTAGWE